MWKYGKMYKRREVIFCVGILSVAVNAHCSERYVNHNDFNRGDGAE